MIIDLNNNDLARFYQKEKIDTIIDVTHFYSNEYVFIKNNNKILPPYLWTGTKLEPIKRTTFRSYQFGDIEPKNDDPFQIAYMDSLVRNQLTFCTGKAGSGKTLIALAYAFQELEKEKIDRIVIFTNPFPALGAVRLGFLPGNKNDKLLDTSLGNILSSKIGSQLEVQNLIEKEKIILIPMTESRGYEVPKNSFVYFTEGQNTSKYLMQLFLQRCSDDCKICVEGDLEQTDNDLFNNDNNGLLKAIEVFKGENYAGHVRLNSIYRGKIAQRAEFICK